VLFKGLWVVLLLLGNLIAVPLYWYTFVWRPHLALPSRRQIGGGSSLSGGSVP
jgi:hypothetical protein